MITDNHIKENMETINDSNDTTPQSQGNGQEQTINPGAIRKSTTQSILKAVSNASGMEFQSIEDLTAAMARLAVQTNTMATSTPTQEPKATKRNDVSELQEQFVALKTDLSKKEQQLRERELDADIRGVMGDKFDTDLLDYALTKVRQNIEWNSDGTYSIINSKGQTRYDDNGNPMSIQGLVGEIAKTNPKLLKQSTSAVGSGLRMNGNFGVEVGDNIPDYSTDPAAFKAWAQRNGLGRGAGLKGVKAQVSVGNTSKRVI
jgi:hypothetical protein